MIFSRQLGAFLAQLIDRDIRQRFGLIAAGRPRLLIARLRADTIRGRFRYVAGTTINVAGSYNMFAFNAGNFYGPGMSSITVVTNLGSYNFSLMVGGVQPPLTFLGFDSDVGEDILSVWMGGGYAIGGTDFQLGNQGPANAGPAPQVPEPTSWALMVAGFGLVGSALRRRRLAVAFA